MLTIGARRALPRVATSSAVHFEAAEGPPIKVGVACPSVGVALRLALPAPTAEQTLIGEVKSGPSLGDQVIKVSK